jgi:hypothetical protein
VAGAAPALDLPLYAHLLLVTLLHGCSQHRATSKT